MSMPRGARALAKCATENPSGREAAVRSVMLGDGEGDGGRDAGALAKKTGSHCGGTTATGWLASVVAMDLLITVTLDLVMCGVMAAWKATARPRRTSARKPGPSFFADFLVG